MARKVNNSHTHEFLSNTGEAEQKSGIASSSNISVSKACENDRTGAKIVSTGNDGTIFCMRHERMVPRFFCRTCDSRICDDCIVTNSSCNSHDYVQISKSELKQLERITKSIQEARSKVACIRSLVGSLEGLAENMKNDYKEAVDDIHKLCRRFSSAIEERKVVLIQELSSKYAGRFSSFISLLENMKKDTKYIHNFIGYCEYITKSSSLQEALMSVKELDAHFQAFINSCADLGQYHTKLKFSSNEKEMRAAIRQTFGCISLSSSEELSASLSQMQKMVNDISRCSCGSNTSKISDLPSDGTGFNNVSDGACTNSTAASASSFAYTAKLNKTPNHILASFLNDGISTSPTVASGVKRSSSKIPVAPIFRSDLHIIRQTMIHHCVFDLNPNKKAVNLGQVNGVTVGERNSIIVTDNSHRIHMFDKRGVLLLTFRQLRKTSGRIDLSNHFPYASSVAVDRYTGFIYLAERFPNNHVQVYNRFGVLVLEFGADTLRHPRGIAVDNQGYVIVVERGALRVIIIDMFGSIHKIINCMQHLSTPNGVAVNDKKEIFIADKYAHCVKVFSYSGAYLRQIGHAGITNYPIGVDIDSYGNVLIADNHNGFNLTVFTQDGQLVSALETMSRWLYCVDFAAMDDGSVVLACADSRIYIYRYIARLPSTKKAIPKRDKSCVSNACLPLCTAV